jgi:trans-aconitate methyltransferase
MPSDSEAHWQNVYTSKAEAEVSWYEDTPSLSLAMLDDLRLPPDSSLVDIGAGASRLVDGLLARSWRDITVLDLSAAALEAARARLGTEGGSVTWIAADIRLWQPQAAAYDVWHDRAAFHFLTDPRDRAAYCATLARAVKPGGYALIAGFAPDGPENCSGLPVMRHDATSVARELGRDFSLRRSENHTHQTPWGSTQRFQYNLFAKRGAS